VSLRRYCLLFAAALIPAAFSQQLPPVYFNHFFMFMDPDTLNDLMASPFLNKEFSAFDKTTMHQDGGKLSYTGIYLDGRATYLEFLPAAKSPPYSYTTGQKPLGTVGFGMWINERSQLPLIRVSLVKQSLCTPEIQVHKEFRNGHDIPWYDAASPGCDSPDTDTVRSRAFVMALYASYPKERYPDLKPEEDGTTREKANTRWYSANRLLREITRLTLTVSKSEENRLAREFAAYGYKIHSDGQKKIASGPEFELAMIPAPQSAPRKLAIAMKLNRAKDGPQMIKIGTTSELRFKGDSAVWYFPKAW
jgi:hypothetical protein